MKKARCALRGETAGVPVCSRLPMLPPEGGVPHIGTPALAGSAQPNRRLL